MSRTYVLTMYQPAGVEPPPPEVLEPVMAELGRLEDEIRSAGKWVFGGGLTAPSSATVVRYGDGQTLVTDGPFIEGTEVVGGFTIVRADDLDEALGWARRMSTATTLPIEVRPFRG